MWKSRPHEEEQKGAGEQNLEQLLPATNRSFWILLLIHILHID